MMGGRRSLRASVAVVAAAATAFVLAAVPADAAPPGDTSPPTKDFVVEVLSSPPDQVSGDDARVSIRVPDVVKMKQVQVTLDGEVITDLFTPDPDDGRRLEGVITGLELGDNELVVSRNRPGNGRMSTTVTLTNHPITGPIFSGPQQQPFQCSTTGHRGNAELGPILDDDCSMETVVSFKYRTTGGSWADYDPDTARPDDMATTTTMDGDTVDYIVRWERGTINRFIYSIAVLSPDAQELDTPDLSAWNERLIYYFQGGVGIGHYQGNPSGSRMLYEHGLSLGYAIAYSTGTKTGEHYNLQVGGETAVMVKDRFVSAYDDPDYTVGVGGSGGGIQQYVYAQNHPGLIDAGVPQYSYPDMITQTIHIGDCELLERWMDLNVLQGNARWTDWALRSAIEGLNATDAVDNQAAALQPYLPRGATECMNAWRGLSPLTLNPNFGTAPGISGPDQVSTEWTHYGDAINVYGTAEDGFAARTWDNVGVQYGLQALLDGTITTDEFVALNATAGGWKNEPDMVQEGCPFIPELCTSPDNVDVWSVRNQTFDLSNPTAVAPRTEADPDAIEAAYQSGLVNHGDIEIPMIDWRNYLERELDMHNSHQSFAARQRLLDWDGDASNQIIWFTDVADVGGDRFDQTPLAFEVIDEWMRNIEANPNAGVAGNKPSRAVDSCFDTNGELIYAGADAWSGILDDGAAGVCTQQFPTYTTSRIVAGGPITGDVFKCVLQPFAQAIADGVYGDVTFTDEQLAVLSATFPDGVCDYAQGDARRPADL
ncbi:hypothetical protein BDK89_3928 [Ilumatobacter fluminis]|uniref:DUF6351 domain-containing protein n=1 Tax=Ilumatobacter fluminis TaxID=467091 RepID=A0A4R7I5N1_9ACTN|nr:hypothetical protein BDK89_3928 [Ilumatobacter fluminis]